MEIPYHFDFNGDSRQKTVLDKLPLWCKYSLKAVNNPHFFSWKQAEIVSQQINHHTFFIDLVELRVKQDFVIPFKITEKNLSLIFVLEGEATFYTDEDKHINVIRNNSFLISIFNKGKFRLKTEAGHHIFLLINMDPEWIEKKLKRLTHIQKIVNIFNKEENSYHLLLQYRINRQIKSWLKKVINYPKQNQETIDSTLKTYVSHILKYYNERVKSRNALAEQVKVYIEENFTDSTLSVSLLADMFCVTRFTLLNHFKRKYGISIQKYYTTLRMEKSQELKNSGLSPNEIFEKVGYTDVRSYRSTRNDYTRRKSKK